MAIIEIAIGRGRYKIDCPENEQVKLRRLADKFNERVKNNLPKFSNIDERTLLVISALNLEDELESKSHSTTNFSQENIIAEKINDSEMHEALTKNIENVAEYIEKLAKKIENY